jgi:hypothetical protein
MYLLVGPALLLGIAAFVALLEAIDVLKALQ